MIRLLTPIALLVIALAFAVATDRGSQPADYTLSQLNDHFTLDPQRMSYNQDLRMAYAIYEPLVRWDNDTFVVEPGVAESWTVSPDGRTYIFRLRDDARWSNGDAVTASDFIYSWKRGVQPDTAANYSEIFFVIEGARAYFDWRTQALADYAARPASERTRQAAQALRDASDRRFAETVGLSAPDDRTLIVTLEQSTPFFLDLCAFGVFCPVHPTTVEQWVSLDADSGRLQQRHEWTKPPRLITNGPYMLTSWRFKRDLRLELNPHYWNPSIVRSQSVRIKIIANANTAVLAFKTGAVDWVEDPEVDFLPDMLAEVERGERDDLLAVPAFGTYFWSFNCEPTFVNGRPNPFHDARVRRAFGMSVDKGDIAGKVRRRGEPVANVMVPPGSIAGFDEARAITGVTFDEEGARALLAEAGWMDRNGDGVLENEAGEPFPVVEMLCSTGAFHEEVALAMGAMWESALNVRTRIVAKESKIYKDDLSKRNYMLARGGWYGDYGDPTTFLNIHRTGDGNNDRGYSDPRFDAMLEEAERTLDPEPRMRILEEAERYVMEETLPVLPIFHYVQYYMFDPNRFRGITRHPRLTQYYWELEVITPDEAPVPVAQGGEAGP